jgi:hypothetical protein
VKARTKATRRRRNAPRARIPYHSPKLVAYGDVRRLTDAGVNLGAVDGMAGYTNTKT